MGLRPTKAAREAERQAIIDEFGEMDRQVKLWQPPVNPYFKRRSELLAIIEGWYTEFPAELGEVVQGEQYQLEVKARQWQRELTHAAKKKAFQAMQQLKVPDAAGKLVKFDPLTVFSTTQEAIAKYLGEAFLDQIAPKARRGRRIIQTVAREAPARSKAA